MAQAVLDNQPEIIIDHCFCEPSELEITEMAGCLVSSLSPLTPHPVLTPHLVLTPHPVLTLHPSSCPHLCPPGVHPVNKVLHHRLREDYNAAVRGLHPRVRRRHLRLLLGGLV